MARISILRLLLLIGLVLGFILGLGYQRWHALRGGPRRLAEHYTPADHPRVDPAELQVLAAIDAEYSRLIGSVAPSVVSIRSRGMAPVDPFEMLLRGTARPPVRQSLGSGVLISREGHVLTNAHVVAGMTEVIVQLTDGRTFPATLVGADKPTDIAVLRIPPQRVDAIPLGDSDKVRAGQTVFAIGNPFGLHESVTQGIISARGRSIGGSGVEFLQTDAAVNQGNSGGPLINLRGEVIGINSAIYSETGGWLGIGFAIPSNTARAALESILKTGRVVRPHLGVGLRDVPDTLAADMGAPDTQGALVVEVQADSPAAHAGVRCGDILRGLDGKLVRDADALRMAVAATSVGTRVALTLLRSGAELSFTIELVETPPIAAPSKDPPASAASGSLPEPARRRRPLVRCSTGRPAAINPCIPEEKGGTDSREPLR